MKKWLILTIIIIIYFSCCIQTSGSIIQDFKFDSGNGKCGGRTEANMTLNNNKILFSGFITTPTPCYKLKASYSINRVEFEKAPTTDVITITITKNPAGDFCIECVGEVPFSGEITVNRELWDSENYGVVIIHKGEELTRIYNYVT